MIDISSDLVAISAPASHGEGSLESYGQSLHWQAHSPETAVAAIIIVHGIGEHQGRYGPMTQTMVANGMAVYGYDQRGHGRSTGTAGHIDHWDQYTLDLVKVIEFVRLLEGDKPIFLFGHSMGALVVLDCAIRFPKDIAGILINGIPLRPGAIARPFMIQMAKLLSLFRPQFYFDLSIDVAGLSSKPEVGIAYSSDPLVHKKVTARWGVSILKAIERLRTSSVSLNMPVFISHGALDPVNLPSGSSELFATIPSKDKSLKIYPLSRHEVHNDMDANEFVDDLCDWVLPRAQPLDQG